MLAQMRPELWLSTVSYRLSHIDHSCGMTLRYGRSSMKRLVMLVGLVAVFALAPLYALAQTQSEEKMLVGRVQSVDDSGTELTLADGTKLLTPPGAQFNPGAFEEGMVVVAMYREQDDGRKVLTRLSRGRSEPAPD